MVGFIRSERLTPDLQFSVARFSMRASRFCLIISTLGLFQGSTIWQLATHGHSVWTSVSYWVWRFSRDIRLVGFSKVHRNTTRMTKVEVIRRFLNVSTVAVFLALSAVNGDQPMHTADEATSVPMVFADSLES